MNLKFALTKKIMKVDYCEKNCKNTEKVSYKNLKYTYEDALKNTKK